MRKKDAVEVSDYEQGGRAARQDWAPGWFQPKKGCPPRRQEYEEAANEHEGEA
jgi:hypothetical protein